MAKSEVDEVTEKTIQNGGILVMLYFDMQSYEQSELQPLMTDLISNRLLKERGVVFCYGTVDEPIKSGDVYTTNAAVTTLFSDIGSLISVIFNYVPGGVEILKPEHEFKIKINQLQSAFVDISNASAAYSEFILQKALSKEEFAKIEDQLKRRRELGHKLLDKKDDKQI